ncbi:MAG: hypothetical protein ABIJ16_01895, partial [Bacteroidota bacterium]
MIFLGIDYGDSEAQVEQFDLTYGVEYPTIAGSSGGTNICNDYQITAYPTAILIAPDHSILVQDIWPISGMTATVEANGGVQQPCYTGITADFTGVPTT